MDSCLPLGRHAFSMKTFRGLGALTYFLPSLGRRCPGRFVGLHVSPTPLFSLLPAPSPFLPFSLSVPDPECRKFCLSPGLTTSLQSGATLSYLSPLVLPLPPPKLSFIELEGKKFLNPQCNLPTHLILSLHAFMDSTNFTEGLWAASIFEKCIRPQCWVWRKI